jgi:phage repressor protein C with HTH and peptisase S24 domain
MGVSMMTTSNHNISIDKRCISTNFQDKEIAIISVYGDSMSPYINHDDFVLFHPMPSDTKPHDGKYVIASPHGPIVKTLSFRANGDVLISSINCDYPPELIKACNTFDLLHIMGIVVGRILKD